MKLTHVRDVLRDYVGFRRLCENPWQTARFRKGQREGELHEVRMFAGGPLYLRGQFMDHHIFHRIWLRDEYRLRKLRGQTFGCVIDLGGNIGLFARRVAPVARRVLVCEPAEENFELLRRNTAGCPNIELKQVALSARTGELRLYRPKHAALVTVFSAHPRQPGGILSDEYTVVPALSLDDLYLESNVEKCDLLKIDIEGQEYDVLHAASPATLAKTERIIGEYHAIDEAAALPRMQALGAHLTAAGFTVAIVPHRWKQTLGMFFATRD